MNKDEALKLALEVMHDQGDVGVDEWIAAEAAIKQALAAPVQPVASLKKVDVLMMAETHGIDPSTKGLYGFYIDCISNQPAAQPVMPDAMHHTDLSETLEYIQGWNDCRAEMLRGKP
jgi:hypothetical protein